MRIIGGTAGGRILKTPKGLQVRPTPDLVRQAVFNSIGSRVEGVQVLELFGGTGALSLECLSRGAAHAVCVEKMPRNARLIRENLRICELPEHSLEIRTQDVFSALSQLQQAGRTFQLVLADPPYGEKNVGRRSESMAQQLLDNTTLPGLMASDSLFILGHARRDTVTLPSFWQEVKTLKHGDTLMRFLVATEEGLN